MVHTSETAICINKNSENILYKTTLFSSCPDHVCLSHELFGMHKNATESSYFLNVGALQNIEMKTFADVIKSVDKQFHCNTESNAHNHLPRYFTTAIQVRMVAILSLDYWSALLPPWTLILFMKACTQNASILWFLRYFVLRGKISALLEKRSGLYMIKHSKVKEFDSWEKVLEEYSHSSFCPQIIFFERIDPVSEAAGTEVSLVHCLQFYLETESGGYF